MNPINLRTVDLNLLTVFQAIYANRQVTRAADALGLTQSAVSHGLSRLRVLFDDELFVRARSRMEPTPRAHELSGPVDDILENVRRIVASERTFDPRSARRTIRLGLPDYGMALYAPEIARILTAEAPGMTLACRDIPVDFSLDMLDSGDLDLALGPIGEVRGRHEKRLFRHSEIVIVARAGHPLLKQGLDIDTYVRLQHIGLAFRTSFSDAVDTALRRVGAARRVVMTVPHYSAAMFTVGKTDLVAAVARGPAELYRDICGLRIYDPPTGKIPVTISLVRHQRAARDPALNWVWERIATLAEL